MTLGLAQQAGAYFAWGPDMNATIVAVSVINQVHDNHDYALITHPSRIKRMITPMMGGAIISVITDAH